MKIPAEMREVILIELPNVIEQIDEATKQIYDPNAIWLEAMQFANYVTQYATHLLEDHGPECTQSIAEQLLDISNSFVVMSEGALRVIDETEDIDGTQF